MRSGLAVSFALAVLGCAHGQAADAPHPAGEAIGELHLGALEASPGWRSPRQWAATSPDAARTLGGDRDRATIDAQGRALWLAFDPPVSPPARALLVLGVADPTSRRTRAAELILRRVADGAELARTVVRPGIARPIVIDVTEHAATALEISIHASEPIELATPRHLDRRARPRLELTRQECSQAAGP